MENDSITYKFYGQFDEPEFVPGNQWCYFIATCKSLLWTATTLISSAIIITSIATPQWLVGKSKNYNSHPQVDITSAFNEFYNVEYHPSIGIFNLCSNIQTFKDQYTDHCSTFVSSLNMPSSEFPDVWKSSIILFGAATILLSVAIIITFLSFCTRTLFGKSIFILSGLVQTIAGLFLIAGMFLYPFGWGSERVKKICGKYTSAFVIDECNLGWAAYSCIIGIALVFVSAILSIQADKSANNNKVEGEITKGKYCIFIA